MLNFKEMLLITMLQVEVTDFFPFKFVNERLKYKVSNMFHISF